MMNQRGLTFIDLVFLLVIGVIGAITLYRIDAVYQTHYRFACYENQKALDKILWDANYENKREIWEVQAAYTIQYPNAQAPVMVILYNPRINEYEHEMTVVPLEKAGRLYELTCPLDKQVHNSPVINYWFYWGRWHCLYNRYHSE